jgi:hypothetical protein
MEWSAQMEFAAAKRASKGFVSARVARRMQMYRAILGWRVSRCWGCVAYVQSRKKPRRCRALCAFEGALERHWASSLSSVERRSGSRIRERTSWGMSVWERPSARTCCALESTSGSVAARVRR